jgi:hypothetical protein
LVCFCELRTSNKDLIWTTTEASTVKNFLRDFRHCLLPSALSNDTGHQPSRDTRLLIIASKVKGPLRPRLYTSPASQPTPANAPSRDTRLLLIASNVKGPLRPRLCMSPASHPTWPRLQHTLPECQHHDQGSHHIASKSPIAAEAPHICQNASTPPSA